MLLINHHNMTCRVENGSTFMQSYNAENRQPPHVSIGGMSGVSQVDGDCDTPGNLLKVWGFVYDGDGRDLCTPSVLCERGSKVKQVYTEGENTLTSYYFAGGSYEVQTDGVTETVKQYYAIAGMTFVPLRASATMRSVAAWSFFLTDHLGSVVGVTDNAGALTAETRYMPSRTMRPRNPRSSGEVGLATPFRVQVCAAMWGR